MKQCSWLIPLVVIAPLGLASCRSASPPLVETQQPIDGWGCFKQETAFENTLGPLRQFPNALGAWMYGHKPTDKLDFGMCYNMRERLKRDMALDGWRKTISPFCQKYFRDRDARFAKSSAIGRKSLEEQVVTYNDLCSHTMAGTL